MPANATTLVRGADGPPAAESSVAQGWVEINPRFRRILESLGLTSSTAILDLPGVVVSGHPDRHVARVELPGFERALYLKRQHRVGWRERLRQRLAGFGGVSRCQREAAILRDLDALGFSCPNWIAHGEDGCGRAFLLVEELPGIELRTALSDSRLSVGERRELAERMGRTIAELHVAGFDTPDLSAKHVFLEPGSSAISLIDWQSAKRYAHLNLRQRLQSLAALHASLTDGLTPLGERLRFLWAYRRVCLRSGLATPRAAELAEVIETLAMKARGRRSIRDQRQPTVTGNLRLVWLAGEAVCAIPEVAAMWPRPAIAPPFYGDPRVHVGPTPIGVRSPDGGPAMLLRGRSRAPVARLIARLRGRPWRSTGVKIGRLLFHLQRSDIPAPRLLAFGQRLTGVATADWFALHESIEGVPLAAWLASSFSRELRDRVLTLAGRVLRQLHDSGCRYSPDRDLFRVVDESTVAVGSVQSIRLVRRLSSRQCRADLNRLLDSLPLTGIDRQRVLDAYNGNS